MLRLGMVACAVCTLLTVGCGKKEGEKPSSGSSASTDSAPSAPSEGARTIIDAVKLLVPTPLAEPEESTAEPEPYVPAVAEDESKTPQLTVDQVLSDPELIDRKYSLREIELSGVVNKVGTDSSAGGVETIWIGSASDKNGTTIACRVRSGTSSGKPAAGSNVIIRGRLVRNLGQSLDDCEVVKDHSG